MTFLIFLPSCMPESWSRRSGRGATSTVECVECASPRAHREPPPAPPAPRHAPHQVYSQAGISFPQTSPVNTGLAVEAN